MTITIAEVIEQCARIVDQNADACETKSHAQIVLQSNATAIRALAEQYEGCIVAEGTPLIMSHFQIAPLYRARETQR
jgi:hypothetical protein